ncbi:hypothetical protein MSAN_00974600 [Mycena sanguinolenta]|uniref:Uncharacterized protein n=1 Tax=Mycena sanguinolenta TaxID=230812 RepID=A0A8H7D9E7_9AGAR|nr:hypothetical protein MSAN_00974600 [Mycena sanguinolenta]
MACFIAEVILQMRLYALFSMNKKVLVLVAIAFIVSSMSSAVIIGTALEGVGGALSNPVPGVTLCVVTGVPNSVFAFWIPILCFESLLCGLALYRGLQTFRLTDTLFQSTNRLVVILIRDSVFYFFVVFATYFIDMLMLVLVTTSNAPFEIGFAFSVALSCCIGNRMMLNMLEEIICRTQPFPNTINISSNS